MPVPTSFGVYASGGGGGGGSYTPEALALFARMSPQPNTTRKTLINNTIVSLMAAGLWTALDAFYAQAQDVKANGLLNWKGATYDLIQVTAGTFTADRGIAAGVYDTGYVINSGQKNSFYLGCWIQNTQPQSVNAIIGSSDVSGPTYAGIAPRFTDDLFYPYVNQQGVGAPTQNNAAGSPGWYAGNRSAAGAVQGYKAATQSTSTQASFAVPTQSIYVGSMRNYLGIHPSRVAAAAIGAASFSSGQNTSLQGIVATYMAAIGA